MSIALSDTPFETLTDRQQAIVDELAQDRIDGRSRTNPEIVDAAAQGADFDPPHPTNVPHVKREYGDVIDERAEARMNGDADTGTDTLEGVDEAVDALDDPPTDTVPFVQEDDNPLEALDDELGDEDDWQTWDERPVKDVAAPDAASPTHTDVETRVVGHGTSDPGEFDGDADDEEFIVLTLTEDDAFDLLSKPSVPEHVRYRLFDTIMER